MIDQVRKTRQERNSALIETMILAASADGRVSSTELQALIARVIERPEFEGTAPKELNALVENAVVKLSTATELESILKSLRTRLPDRHNRLLAFGLAASVAFADGRATRDELGLLKSVQAALGIEDEDVAEVVLAVESGRPLPEVLGVPPEKLFAEVMVLVASADGRLHPEELERLVENLAGDPTFARVNADQAIAYVQESAAALNSQGVPHRLAALARGLSTHSNHKKAYRLALEVAESQAAPNEATERVLHMLQASFGISDAEAKSMRAVA